MSTKTKKNLQVTLPTFNKKNAKLFADLIYSDKGGVVSFVKLCEGVLANKDGSRTTHCAIGEAYHMFVSRNVAVLETRTDGGYESEFSDAEGATGRAIDSLVMAAQLKNPQAKIAFGEALSACVASNDDVCATNNDTVTYLERAEEVAKTWMEQVVPLLK